MGLLATRTAKTHLLAPLGQSGTGYAGDCTVIALASDLFWASQKISIHRLSPAPCPAIGLCLPQKVRLPAPAAHQPRTLRVIAERRASGGKSIGVLRVLRQLPVGMLRFGVLLLHGACVHASCVCTRTHQRRPGQLHLGSAVCTRDVRTPGPRVRGQAAAVAAGGNRRAHAQRPILADRRLMPRRQSRPIGFVPRHPLLGHGLAPTVTWLLFSRRYVCCLYIYPPTCTQPPNYI